jgi:hypothetical protein
MTIKGRIFTLISIPLAGLALIAGKRLYAAPGLRRCGPNR